mmetsp:Transcript_8424/g.31457  ORF Transcript_8424/g.31457 Transcript_8424/m.31457 type:complete len:266 (+) Transcript_8424:1290-2087(+)
MERKTSFPSRRVWYRAVVWLSYYVTVTARRGIWGWENAPDHGNHTLGQVGAIGSLWYSHSQEHWHRWSIQPVDTSEMYSSSGFQAWFESPVPASVMFSDVIIPRKFPGSFRPCVRCVLPRQVAPVQYGYATRSMPGMTAMGRKATAFDVAVLALVPVAYDPPSTEAYVPLSASAAQWVSFVANPSTLTTFICSVPTALDTNRPAMRVRQLSTRVWYLLVAPYTTVCVCAERVTLPTSVAGNSGTATETPVSSVTVIDPVSNSKRV